MEIVENNRSVHRVGKQFEKLRKVKMITRASSYMMDLVKDSLILIEILISQNGFDSLMAQETPYIKGVKDLIYLFKFQAQNNSLSFRYSSQC